MGRWGVFDYQMPKKDVQNRLLEPKIDSQRSKSNTYMPQIDAHEPKIESPMLEIECQMLIIDFLRQILPPRGPNLTLDVQTEALEA